MSAAAKLSGSLPFKPDVITSLDCRAGDGPNELVCQIGIAGAKDKTQLRIKSDDLPFKNVHCTRDASGNLVCSAETANGKEDFNL
jgi:hypothetical protein